MGLYDIAVTTLDGRSTTLAEYRGKVLLVVNVASKCGFTGQYAGLEDLHQRYADAGLAVLGFPCNQFAGQEPGDAAAIAQFCSLSYGVKFPMFAKVNVPANEHFAGGRGRHCQPGGVELRRHEGVNRVGTDG